MLTINQLAKRHGLSRSTLLYYDRIGLLSPSARSQSNYRLYSPKDVEKMQKIALYREAGLSLEAIADIIHSQASKPTEALEHRLVSLNEEIHELRKQQQLIVSLLGKESSFRVAKTMSKDQWVAILRSSGMDENDMHQWHIAFERDLPEVHQDFLQSLGCSEDEIDSIRKWSRKAD